MTGDVNHTLDLDKCNVATPRIVRNNTFRLVRLNRVKTQLRDKRLTVNFKIKLQVLQTAFGITAHDIYMHRQLWIGQSAAQKQRLQQRRLPAIILPEEQINLLKAFYPSISYAPKPLYFNSAKHDCRSILNSYFPSKIGIFLV